MQAREQCKALQARAESAEKQSQALEDVRSKALVLARQNGTLQACLWLHMHIWRAEQQVPSSWPAARA